MIKDKVIINNRIYIDIAINRSNFNRVKMRNYLYFSKIYIILIGNGNKKISILFN